MCEKNVYVTLEMVRCFGELTADDIAETHQKAPC